MATFEVGDEVVIVGGNGIPQRLDGIRAIVERIADNGKLVVFTGNQHLLIRPNQVERNAAE